MRANNVRPYSECPFEVLLEHFQQIHWGGAEEGGAVGEFAAGVVAPEGADEGYVSVLGEVIIVDGIANIDGLVKEMLDL